MHFTYQSSDANAELQQGDILQRTPALDEVLRKIHPYYIRDDYRYFAVLTQSCDLVRTPGRSPSKYITIGAIRPLSFVIDRELEKYKNNYVTKLANVAPESSRNALKQFLERLLNNNESEYFYLHDDVQVGLAQPSCIFLRLSIALHSQHYETCRLSRIVSLEPTFQAKLGWLVGNIFSRVGTNDWVPKTHSAAQWKAMIDDILARSAVFMNDRKIAGVKKAKAEQELVGKPEQEIRDLIEATPERKKKDEAIEVFLSELSEITPPSDQVKIKRRLENNPSLASLFK
jgi:hypothetical protein